MRRYTFVVYPFHEWILNVFKELQYYYSELGKGMHGPLNYYRTSKFRHDEELG
jgi:hypothetical protein